MSNDTYSGSSLSNLRPATPEDADGFNVDARALRQIKRYLKNSDGLIQTITDILTNEEITVLDKFKGVQVYSRPNAVIALRSDINPNDSDKYVGRWEKLNGVSICGTGHINVNTPAFLNTIDDVGFPIVDHNLIEFNNSNGINLGSLKSNVIDSTVRITPIFSSGGTSAGAVFYAKEKAYVIFPIYPDLNNRIDVTITTRGNGYTSPWGSQEGWGCSDDNAPTRGGYGLIFTMWLTNDWDGANRFYNHTGAFIGNNTTRTFSITKTAYASTRYLLLDFGTYFQGFHGIAATLRQLSPYMDITVKGNNNQSVPNYNLNWVLTASQYSNCRLDQVIEKHSDRTYRLMLRIYKDANVTASLNQIYFYTFVGNINVIKNVSVSIKNAWSLYSNEYMSNWPYLALSGNDSILKYPNYKIKITLSKSPVYNPDGVTIGETTIEDALRNGIYFNNIENTLTDIANGYIVLSIVSPTSIELNEDTLWWLADIEVSVNLNKDYSSNNYSTFDVELDKEYNSALPLKGINFWKRIDDGKE